MYHSKIIGMRDWNLISRHTESLFFPYLKQVALCGRMSLELVGDSRTVDQRLSLKIVIRLVARIDMKECHAIQVEKEC